MAGVTDAPFRALAWRFGAGYVVGEMVSARGELWDSVKSRLRRRAVPGVSPFVVQIAGGDASSVAESAARHCEIGAEVIDINFGCPAKKVCRKAAGSQLLKDPQLVVDIVTAVVRAVPVPVTVKMRTGFAPEMKNAPELAVRLEDAGVAALSVHGRTRACGFRGTAEHDTVAEIVRRVGIPVFANGDIESVDEARRVMEHTSADGVMVGRGALGRPWLLGDIAAGSESRWNVGEILAVTIEHVRAMHGFYGDSGIRIARKHVQWYLRRLVGLGATDQRSRIAKAFNRLESAQAQLDFLYMVAAFAAVEEGRWAA